MRIIIPVTITPDDAGAGQLDSSNVAENDHSEYSGATTYNLGDRVIVTDPGYHRIYESQVGSNTGNYPPDNPTEWINVSATNRWKMFDGVSANKTQNATSIDISITPGDLINAVALFNLRASSVDVVLDDPTDGEVYNQTFDLSDNSNITDWYHYFFEPILRKQDLFIVDMPSYSTATLDVTINQPGGTAECGQIVMGTSIQIGTTEWGAQSGIIDYSIKDTDSFGNAYLLQRKFSRRATFDIVVPHPAYWVERLLAEYRATPLAWSGSMDSDYGITQIFGFYRDFNIVLAHVGWAMCSIEVEGL